MEKVNHSEPFVRISKRDDISVKNKILIRSICVLSALVICILFITAVSHKNPFIAIQYIFEGTFQTSGKFLTTLQDTLLLLGVSLALLPAFKMRFWNVGAQGQILIGGLMSAVIMVYLPSSTPNVVAILLCLLGAIIGGGLWGVVPAIFKAKHNTNETLFTLMMNYIAIQLVAFTCEQWKGDKAQVGILNRTTKLGYLPTLFGNKVFLILLFIIALMTFIFVYIYKSKKGYEIQVVGESLNTARYSGIQIKDVIIRNMALSGGVCGIIGFFYVCGLDHTISVSTGGGYGFTAIIIAWLSSLNPFIMVGYSFLITFLTKGAKNLSNRSYSDKLNEYSCEVLIFVIIISLMLSEFFIRYRVVFRKLEKTKSKENISPNVEGGN
jgi:ABC-type uncharacterized transport system permease subunit